MRTLLVELLVLASLAGAMAGCGESEDERAGYEPAQVTSQRRDMLRAGMELDEVQRILGKGMKTSRTDPTLGTLWVWGNAEFRRAAQADQPYTTGDARGVGIWFRDGKVGTIFSHGL